MQGQQGRMRGESVAEVWEGHVRRLLLVAMLMGSGLAAVAAGPEAAAAAGERRGGTGE